MISEHSDALDTVRQVVVQLNETVEEGKEEIQETVAVQVQRHLRELRGLRSIMHNFTDLLETLLSDKIDKVTTLALRGVRSPRLFLNEAFLIMVVSMTFFLQAYTR